MVVKNKKSCFNQYLLDANFICSSKAGNSQATLNVQALDQKEKGCDWYGSLRYPIRAIYFTCATLIIESTPHNYRVRLRALSFH